MCIGALDRETCQRVKIKKVMIQKKQVVWGSVWWGHPPGRCAPHAVFTPPRRRCAKGEGVLCVHSLGGMKERKKEDNTQHGQRVRVRPEGPPERKQSVVPPPSNVESV